jgi:hypothetical protein
VGADSGLCAEQQGRPIAVVAAVLLHKTRRGKSGNNIVDLGWEQA